MSGRNKWPAPGLEEMKSGHEPGDTIHPDALRYVQEKSGADREGEVPHPLTKRFWTDAWCGFRHGWIMGWIIGWTCAFVAFLIGLWLMGFEG